MALCGFRGSSQQPQDTFAVTVARYRVIYHSPRLLSFYFRRNRHNGIFLKYLVTRGIAKKIH